jgi:hypothetical protein
MNDEARMTNDEGMTKQEGEKKSPATFRYLFIRHSFEVCHSSFVVL